MSTHFLLAADVDPSGEKWQAQVISHACSTGKPLQALILQLPEGHEGLVALDHVIFVDTSASQVGAHRKRSLLILESFLETLPASNRVRLFAIDTQVESLMPSFAAPGSESTQSGLAELKRRIPLGATNLKAIVPATMEAKDPDRPCSIIYIGDGISSANMLEISDLQQMTAGLSDSRIPFHCYGVGPVLNLEVLGLLAHQTGGYIDFDRRIDEGENQVGQQQVAGLWGQRLADAVQRGIVFPTKVTTQPELDCSFTELPLRSDRETIHVVRGEIPEGTSVVVETDPSKPALVWKVSAPVEQPESAFLSAVAERCDADEGFGNFLAGRKVLQVYQTGYSASIVETLQYAQRQLDQGHFENANRIAQSILSLNPANKQAQSLAEKSEKLRVHRASLTKANRDIADPNLDSAADSGSNLLRDQEIAVRVKADKLWSQLNTALSDSKKGAPEAGLVRLKQVENTVRSATDISADERIKMLKYLENDMQVLRNQADRLAQDRVQLAQQLSLLEAQKRLAENFSLEEEKLEGLLDRVRGLMYEGQHGRDEAYGEAQNVADVAINLRPGAGPTAAARFDSEAAQQLNRAYRLRARRADQFLESLHQVELAHIPFPDEPPIRFPTAQVWKALTERRRKWVSVDMHRNSPYEEKIQQELKATTEVNFVDTPLRDALDFLKENHHIQIWPDTKTISDEGLSLDQPVTLSLSGVSLKSALRLMLEPLLLTYVIEDDVLKITSQSAADEKTQSRVYPVADLTTPIMSMGMGGMGGMRGGMGGGMGGMGGGMGGMGGMGMGGMGGMGMGGGFF